jgi:hypothetical protein
MDVVNVAIRSALSRGRLRSALSVLGEIMSGSLNESIGCDLDVE